MRRPRRHREREARDAGEERNGQRSSRTDDTPRRAGWEREAPDALMQALRRLYDGVAREPVPRALSQLLDRLKS
jgi:anti-sigma factor NepR-like protein